MMHVHSRTHAHTHTHLPNCEYILLAVECLNASGRGGRGGGGLSCEQDKKQSQFYCMIKFKLCFFGGPNYSKLVFMQEYTENYRHLGVVLIKYKNTSITPTIEPHLVQGWNWGEGL